MGGIENTQEKLAICRGHFRKPLLPNVPQRERLLKFLF